MNEKNSLLDHDHLLRKDTLLLRDALCEFLEERYGKIRFLEEKNIGKVRADMIAVLPTGLLGIEIKSHSDSYTRLEGQIKGYNQYCDFCFLAAGSIHARMSEHVPPSWGLIEIDVHMGARFAVTREAEPNRKDPLKNQLSLLWRNELTDLLTAEKLPKHTSKSKKFIIEFLLEKVPHDRLKMRLCDALFERDYTRFQEK